MNHHLLKGFPYLFGNYFTANGRLLCNVHGYNIRKEEGQSSKLAYGRHENDGE